MTEQIMKLLKSSNEEDNLIGLVLFKKTRATNKELCMYLHNQNTNGFYYVIAQRYFMNYRTSSRPRMRWKWRKLLK